jgi:hypothetical protein
MVHDMTRDVDNPKRCTHTHRQRNGTTIECSDVGHWTLDKANKTWRPAAPGDKSRRCWTHGPGSETKPIGKGGRRRTQPNARIQLAAGILLDLAPEFTKVQNGLCPRCYQNERRWRQQHEMPAREEPAA